MEQMFSVTLQLSVVLSTFLKRKDIRMKGLNETMEQIDEHLDEADG